MVIAIAIGVAISAFHKTIAGINDISSHKRHF